MDAEVPDEVDVRGAPPGDWLGIPVLVLGRLPDPLDVDDDEEEGEEDGDEEPEDGDPPDEGIPLEELLDDDDETAHPEVARAKPTAATVTARCSRAVTTVVARSMSIAPSGTKKSRFRRFGRLSVTSTARAGRVWTFEPERYLTFVQWPGTDCLPSSRIRTGP